MRRAATRWTILAAVLSVVGVCYWQRSAAREGEAGPLEGVRAAGWDVLVGGGEPKQYVEWSGWKIEPTAAQRKRMATVKAKITEGAYNGSCTLKVRFSAGSDQMGIQSITVAPAIFSITLGAPVASGDGWNVPYDIDAPGGPYSFVKHVATASGELNLAISWTLDGATLQMTPASTPIGEKPATHAKEQTLTDEWYHDGSTATITVDGFSTVVTYSGLVPASLAFSGTFDPDEWGDLGGYVVSLENVKFGGVVSDLSSITRTIWYGSEESGTYLYYEGTEGGTLGLGGTNILYNYCSCDAGSINAPLIYDFRNVEAKWLSGTLVDTLIVTNEFIRLLNNNGEDCGPWKGTLAALHDMGQIVQKHHIWSGDSWDADLVATGSIYADYDSMRAHGALDHGMPELNVDACMYGVTFDDEGNISEDSAVDGDYWKMSDTMYTNGSYWCWCDPNDQDTWYIGPDPRIPAYYTTEGGGGPGGIYMFNEDGGWEDAVIDVDLEWKRFTGMTGFGPVATVYAEGTVIPDPLESSPSWGHDCTFIIDGPNVAMTNRAGSPYMTGLFKLIHSDYVWVDEAWQHVDGIGIYADACEHGDWVASAGCTVPDANGNFVVSAAGATLTLTLPSNYIERQAHTYTTLPQRYWYRRHDVLLGQGDETFTEVAEAIYDWRGWGYLRSKFTLPEGVTTTSIGMTLTYHMDLDGISDSHKTGGDRDLDYSYDPGELHTYSFTRDIIRQDEDGNSPFLLDLYGVGQPVALVTTFTFTFTDVGAYKLFEPKLISDDGDIQEPTIREVALDPAYHMEIHGGVDKVFDSPGYAQGGISAIWDGVYGRAGLYWPDNSKPNRIEQCGGFLNPLYGAKSGIDMTTVMTLGGLPVQNSSDAWWWVHDVSAELAYLTDVDGQVLKTLTAADIRTELGASMCAVRVYQMTCVNGLPYTFYATKIMGGLAQGMATTSDTAYPRLRTYDPYEQKATLYRRVMGDTTDANWQAKDADVRPNSAGNWYAPRDYTEPYTDGPTSEPSSGLQVLWDYGIKGNGGSYVALGQFYTREYIEGDCQIVAGAKSPCMSMESVTGICHLVYVDGGNIRYCQSDPWSAGTGFPGWRYGGLTSIPGTPQTIAVFPGGYEHPSVVELPTGEVIVSARASASPYGVTLKHTLNQGETWEDVPVGTFVANLTQLALWQHYGILHGAGIVGTNAVYRRSDDGGTVAAPLDWGGTATATICAADDEQPAIVRDPTGVLYASVVVGGTVTIMFSDDGGNTWAQADTV